MGRITCIRLFSEIIVSTRKARRLFRITKRAHCCEQKNRVFILYFYISLIVLTWWFATHYTIHVPFLHIFWVSDRFLFNYPQMYCPINWPTLLYIRVFFPHFYFLIGIKSNHNVVHEEFAVITRYFMYIKVKRHFICWIIHLFEALTNTIYIFFFFDNVHFVFLYKKLNAFYSGILVCLFLYFKFYFIYILFNHLMIIFSVFLIKNSIN